MGRFHTDRWLDPWDRKLQVDPSRGGGSDRAVLICGLCLDFRYGVAVLEVRFFDPRNAVDWFVWVPLDFGRRRRGARRAAAE